MNCTGRTERVPMRTSSFVELTCWNLDALQYVVEWAVRPRSAASSGGWGKSEVHGAGAWVMGKRGPT